MSFHIPHLNLLDKNNVGKTRHKALEITIHKKYIKFRKYYVDR